jgi:hypothetical protein
MSADRFPDAARSSLINEVKLDKYEIRFFDRCHALVLTRCFFARNDGSAWSEFRRGSDKHTLEIWREDRLVGRLEKLFKPARYSTRHSSSH